MSSKPKSMPSKTMGVEFKTGVEVGKDVTIADLRKQGYEAFYVAIGAQGGRKLGVPGEDAEGVISGVDFLRGVNLGKGQKLHGKVVLMGAGNVAIDVARTAIRYGAESSTSIAWRAATSCRPPRTRSPKPKPKASRSTMAGASKSSTRTRRANSPRSFSRNAPPSSTKITSSIRNTMKPSLTVPCDFFLAAIGQSFEWGKPPQRHQGRGQLAAGLEADPLTYQTAESGYLRWRRLLPWRSLSPSMRSRLAKKAPRACIVHVHPGQSMLIGRVQNPYLAKYELDKDNIDVQGWDNTPRQK
jgi:hypothetical protein